MGNDATVNEIEEVWFFLASVGGALLVILLVRDISQWCRDRLLERRISMYPLYPAKCSFRHRGVADPLGQQRALL